MPEDRKRVRYCAYLLAFISAVPCLAGLLYSTLSQPMPYHLASTGMTYEEIKDFNPSVADFMTHSVRTIGIYTLALGIFSFVIAVKPFRQAERWAWFALLLTVFPVMIWLAWTSLYVEGGAKWIPRVQLFLFLVAMLLPIKDFFDSRIDGG